MNDRAPVKVPPGVAEALRFQLAACSVESLDSPLYACVLEAALADLGTGGPCAVVLAETPAELDPIPDAISLRFLGELHRLVLEGRDPALGAFYPSAGGHFDPADGGQRRALVDAFRAAVDEHADALVAGLSRGVQTNEVGRCASLAVGFLEMARVTGRPLRLLEIGASAGLNLRWDHYRYEGGAGGSAFGDPASPIRFTSNYVEPAPNVSPPPGGVEVTERRGCDRSPVDPTTAEGRRVLHAYVWPDQAARHALLEAALGVAAEVPATVEVADAGDWLAGVLAEPAAGAATVVFHSIVWQYLPDGVQRRVLAALDEAAGRATEDAPLAWLRMEPGPDLSRAAEVRLQSWPGGHDRLLARSGYHGWPVRLPRQ